MIAYDMVLEDLPERVRELTVRLRDLVLSLGPGIVEQVRPHSLEYDVTRKFAVLTPDRMGVSLKFHGPFDPPLDDNEDRLTVQGSNATLRLASAADIDESLRRVCRNAFMQTTAKEKARKQVEIQEVPEQLREALDNVSRGLRLLVHHMQSSEKAAQLKLRSLERQGQKRSHKKKPPPAPPPLVIGEGDATTLLEPKKSKPAPKMTTGRAKMKPVRAKMKPVRAKRNAGAVKKKAAGVKKKGAEVKLKAAPAKKKPAAKKKKR